MTILYSYDLDQRTKKVQDNERFMVRINGNDPNAIKLRQEQIEKQKDNIYNDLQIRLYELMIREKVLSDIYDEITGDKNMNNTNPAQVTV